MTQTTQQQGPDSVEDILDLDVLIAPPPKVRLGGEEHEVRTAINMTNAEIAQLDAIRVELETLSAAQDGDGDGAEMGRLLDRQIAIAVPTLEADEISALSITQKKAFMDFFVAKTREAAKSVGMEIEAPSAQ